MSPLIVSFNNETYTTQMSLSIRKRQCQTTQMSNRIMILELKKTLFSLLHIQIHQILESRKGGIEFHFFFFLNLNFKNPEAASISFLHPPQFSNSSLELTS